MSNWEHQARNIRDHALDASHALFWEPRIGKSRTMIGHMRRLIDERAIDRILIVAPKMPIALTWKTELQEDARWDVFDTSKGTIAKRCELVASLCASRRRPRPARPIVLLVNYDVIQKMRPYLCRFQPDLLIADEAHLCKHQVALRTMALQRIGDFSRFKRVLTGTPDPQSYADYYSIYRFLDKQVFGTRLKDFRARYCEMHPNYRTTVIGYNKENYEELKTKVHSLASREIRSECFDVPNVQVIERRIELPAEARKLYQEIAKKNVVLGEDHTAIIDGSHKLTRLGILSRLSAGFVTIDEEIVWKHTEKIEAAVSEAKEIVEYGGKVVVFFLWRAEGNALLAAFQREYGEDRVAKLDGTTQAHTREEITAPFDPSRQSDLPLQVLIVQEKVGALGVSFARADHAIFSSYSMDYADHSQAADRIWKPNGKIALTYLVVPNSVDVTARRNIAEKGARSRQLLDEPFEKLASGEA